MRVRDPEELSIEFIKVKLMAIALNQENTDLQKEVDRVQTTIVALEHLELQLKDEKDRLQTLCDRNTVLQTEDRPPKTLWGEEAAAEQQYASILTQTKSLEDENSSLDSEILKLSVQYQTMKPWVQQYQDISTNLKDWDTTMLNSWRNWTVNWKTTLPTGTRIPSSQMSHSHCGTTKWTFHQRN